ncbi:hypothetical protein DSL72_007181 [Monilinia vaccinii-corymbosi]|uniref:Uncharacterized protein n=1 Tax=Monilinia vaccinii-corymbosi TaxID=61207 RepID=A0A8A3PKX0_9HELO|nr:hypothetical protein DSL72_007181 [Monilinia vaccinii-corymbosi]
MDSKLPTHENDDGSAPPSYLDSLSSPSPVASKIPGPSASKSTTYGSQIQTQLTHLSTQFSLIQKQKSLLAHAREEKLLSLLTSHIQSYLSDFANAGARKGRLILIPTQCLENERAEPLDFHGEDNSGYDVFVEVGDKESLDSGVWFWDDEDLAARLAGALRPSPELPPRQPVTQQQQSDNAVVNQAGSSSRFWKKRSSSKMVEKPALVGDMKVAPAVSEPRDKVLMDVKAEEVVFEHENDFGLLETQRGYAVVLYLKVIITTN